MKLNTAIDQTATLLANDTPILWAGPPGVGKTDGTAEVAARRGERVLVTHPVTRLPEDYNGIPRTVDTPDGMVAKWFAIGQLAELLAPDCPPTLLVVDDVAQARGPVQAAIMHLTLARTVAEQPLSDNVSIMLCANRRAHDPLAANDLSSALANRVWLMNIEHDYEGFASWIVKRPEHDPVVASYALFRRNCFAETVPDSDGIPIFCSPRSLARVGKGLRRMPDMDRETIAGAVGDDIAGDIMLYRDSMEELIPLNDMLRQPGFIKQIGDPGLVSAYLCQVAGLAQSEPARVPELKAWAAKLHGEFRETLEMLAPVLAQ